MRLCLFFLMLLLALETTERFGSVAMAQNDRVIAEKVLPRDRQSAQTLAETLDLLFQETGYEPKNVNVVATVIGPGSFTGLRVGVCTAKVFAYTTHSQMVAVRSLETVARAFQDAAVMEQLFVRENTTHLTVAVDAQRSEVVAQTFQRTPENRIEPVGLERLISITEWWAEAERYPVLFSGPALERYGVQAPADVRLAPQEYWQPRASAVAMLGAERFGFGDTVSPFAVLPIYARQSAAEERLSAGAPTQKVPRRIS